MNKRSPRARCNNSTFCRAAAIVLALSTVLLAACAGGGGGSGTPNIQATYTANSGVAQKGPLIKGSTVTAQELDATLSPTGKQYTYQINSDLGTFSPTSTFGSQYIGLNATGYYFDEVQNDVSSGTATLESYSDLSVERVVNVNILTTLAYQRIRNLVVTSKMSFSASRTQAEGEVLAALNIPVGGYGTFGTLDLSGTSDGDHILAAISSLFIYGNQAGQLSLLINNFQNDLGTNGTLTSAATKTALAAAAKALNPGAIAANLNGRYASLGVTLTATDIADWIDQDGDGVVGKFKFQVPDATPSTTFTFPTFVVNRLVGTSVSVTAGQLAVNGTPSTGSVTVSAGDVVTLSPKAGSFPNGVLNVYLLSAGTRVARVSFVNGLLSIAVTPAMPSMAKGLTEQFVATGTFSDTSTADLTNTVTWSSGTPAVATVNATGLARGVATGSATITATSGSVTGRETLTVTAAVLESLAITPTSPRSGIGLTRQLTATGTYSDGTTADVTNLANWTSSAPAVATVGSQTGLTTGVSLGSSNIATTFGSLTDSVSLTIVSNSWSAAASLLQARVAHTATLLNSGKVLVVGGVDSSMSTSATATTEVYDPVADTWRQSTNLLTARQYHTATLLPNGKVLVAGGMSPPTYSMPMASAEIYDPVAGTWTAAAPMTSPRIYHTATLLPNGKVLVVGGTGGPSLPAPVDSAEVYDPVANSWSPATNLPAARTLHTATLLANGSVLIAGGETSGVASLALNGLVYDPSTNTWTSTGNLQHPRDSHTATLLSNGRVLITGGSDQSTQQASTELYELVANTWSSVGTLLVARASHTATLLPSGKILLAGGGTPSGVTNSAELYDPSTNTSSAAGSLIAARDAHSATLLSNGVVLVVGGWGNSNSPIRSAELYW
jgi:N-acetylneuraminic acid mutarotase